MSKQTMGPTAKWEPNAYYERLIELRRTNRRAYDSLSQPAIAALHEYEAQKRLHQLINSDEPPTKAA